MIGLLNGFRAEVEHGGCTSQIRYYDECIRARSREMSNHYTPLFHHWVEVGRAAAIDTHQKAGGPA